MFFQMGQQHKNKLTRLALQSAMVLAMVAPSLAHAQDASKKAAAPAPAAGTGTSAGSSAPAVNGQGDKLDVSGLENKYWAAKDSDFNVVQNRVYSKAGRFAVTGSFGSLVNDPWTTGTVMDGSLAYYFNEHWGVEFHYSQITSQDNQAVQRLRGQLGFPDHNQLTNFYGLQADWVPFYAKMSLMNWAIIYSDLQIALGAGMQGYQEQESDGNPTMTTPAVTLDITESFYITRYVALRIDLKNRWYSEQTVKYNLTNGTHASNGNDTANATLLMAGLTVFFP